MSKRAVIVGAGFGGLAAAMGLAGSDVDVVIVDRHNYHLFQPLLYQVATAGLSGSDIASPIRSIMRDFANVSAIMGEVSGIDLDQREALVGGRRIPFDILIIATGAMHSYFGRDEWAAYAPGLKTLEDATELRHRILQAFEKAETETDPQLRQRLLTFVVVGGGPTGVEMAGAIAELAKRALAKDFRAIDPTQARIVLVEAGERVLTSFDETLSDQACRDLSKMGVELRMRSAVTEIDARGVHLGGDVIEAATVIWAAGVMASPASSWLRAKTDRAGRVIVNPDLSLPGDSDIFVIGDTAHTSGPDNTPLPGTAAVAKQQGEYVARLILARSRRSIPPFRYRDYGSMATIGRKRAIAQIGRFRFSGFPAWLLWSFAHIYFLIGFRNRLAVMLNWIWNYLTFERGTRIILARPRASPDASHSRGPSLNTDSHPISEDQNSRSTENIEAR